MSIHVYRIECLTNLHIGSGDLSYSVIDNEVEKDPVTDYPIIPSSSLKGALRERFKELSPEDRYHIFGPELKDRDSKKMRASAYKFFSGDFLSRPLRVTDSTSARTYMNVTTPQAMTDFLRKMKLLGVDDFPEWEEFDFSEYSFFVPVGSDVTEMEGEKVGKSDANSALLTALFGENYAVVKSLDEYELPITARCYLENGISQKLWYEQQVPHESVFYTVIITPEGEPCAFDEEFSRSLIQLGGYATIGYGFTKFEKLREV